MELERLRDGGTHILLSFNFLKVLLELFLESLEVWDWLCLAWLEGKKFVNRLGSLLCEIPSISLDLLFYLMLLHARGEP